MTNRNIEVPGLTEQVEILIDRWGVPHIYAGTTDDLYFAQGFNAARDRLWQLDFSRRRGLGLLAEVFGEKLVPWDRAARRFVYRGDMRSEWLAYANSAKRVASKFTAGINAYISLIDSGEVELPLEFKALNYRPHRWNPEDVTLLRAHGLAFNARQEVHRAFTLHNWGSEVEKLRSELTPEHEPIIQEDFDFSQIVPEVLKEYDLGTLPVNFSGTTLEDLNVERFEMESDGSNNWVLAPSRTATGRPIVANDPHRVTSTLPSLRYIAHLSGPEFDVIGAGEQLLPGISIGHNGKIAFGLTIFAIDQEDIFVHELHPNDPDRYRYKGEWRRFDRVREEIPVRDSSPVDTESLFTEFGPVFYHNPKSGIALSLAAGWLQAGGAPYLGSIEYMRAETIEDFLDAMNRWATPPENQIVADTNGRIAWKPGGLTPVRKNWDGTVPVPGNGTYEWAGFYDADVLPMRVEPDDGFVVTANQMLLDDDRDPDVHVTYDWYPSFRAKRATELISSSDKHTLREAFDYQMDTLSVVARSVLSSLSDNAVFSHDPLGRSLLSWDFRMSKDSRAALEWEVWWWQYLTPALFRNRIDELGHADDLDEIMKVLDKRDNPDRDHRPALNELYRLKESDPRTLDEVLKSSLADARNSLEDVFADKTWGDEHRGYAIHPLADLLIEAGVPEHMVKTPELPKGGAAETVGMGSYGTDFRQVAGSTFRIAVDVGNWDDSIVLNSPGQTGNIDDPNSQQLFQMWVDEEPFPLLYSRPAIEENLQSTITLKPRR